MAKQQMLAVFGDAESAAGATEALEGIGITPREFDVISSTPYPEGAFGEHTESHRLYVFPFIGAALGLTMALLLTVGTQISYPVVTGGKPILSIPPMAIISYEGTLLGAILFTVIGIIFESRLVKPKTSLYDPRINDGYVGILVTCADDKAGSALQVLKDKGAEDIHQKEESQVTS